MFCISQGVDMFIFNMNSITDRLFSSALILFTLPHSYRILVNCAEYKYGKRLNESLLYKYLVVNVTEKF